MKVKDLIQKLSKLPQDEEIYFCSYDNYYDAEVNWDITKEEYEKGYKDSPYIYLTKKGRRWGISNDSKM